MSNDPAGRARLIEAVKTPLGFFTLTVLIVEVILGLLASRASGRDFSVLLGSMIVLIFVLVGCIVFLVLRRPEQLLGLDAVTSSQALSLGNELRKARAAADTAESAAARWEQEALQLRGENAALSARLSKLDSLKNRVWTLLHHSESVSLSFLLQELGATDSTGLRNDILAIIGVLIDEGKVERALNTGYYKAVKR